MSLEAGIQARCADDSTLAAYFADTDIQINDKPVGKESPFPYLQFKRLDSPNYDKKPENWERWRFIVTHTDFRDCKEIRDRVVALFFKGYGELSGFQVNNAQVINQGSDPVFNTEISAFQVLDLDVRFSYYN